MPPAKGSNPAIGQTLGVGDIDNILGDIRGVLGEAADRGIIGDDQRPLELEH